MVWRLGVRDMEGLKVLLRVLRPFAQKAIKNLLITKNPQSCVNSWCSFGGGGGGGGACPLPKEANL